jgi:hypothetical protein
MASTADGPGWYGPTAQPRLASQASSSLWSGIYRVEKASNEITVVPGRMVALSY